MLKEIVKGHSTTGCLRWVGNMKDILIVEGLHLLMLSIAESGIGCAQHLHGAAGSILGGNQVDALLLTPLMVLSCLADQLQSLGKSRSLVGAIVGVKMTALQIFYQNFSTFFV